MKPSGGERLLHMRKYVYGLIYKPPARFQQHRAFHISNHEGLGEYCSKNSAVFVVISVIKISELYVNVFSEKKQLLRDYGVNFIMKTLMCIHYFFLNSWLIDCTNF